jgi:hypothetical protein
MKTLAGETTKAKATHKNNIWQLIFERKDDLTIISTLEINAYNLLEIGCYSSWSPQHSSRVVRVWNSQIFWWSRLGGWNKGDGLAEIDYPWDWRQRRTLQPWDLIKRFQLYIRSSSPWTALQMYVCWELRWGQTNRKARTNNGWTDSWGQLVFSINRSDRIFNERSKGRLLCQRYTIVKDNSRK